MPATGVRKQMHRPGPVEVAKVSPRSTNERRAGPTTFQRLYGPVTVAPGTLSTFVRTTQGPNLTTSRPAGPTTTAAACGFTPKSLPHRAVLVSTENGNRHRDEGSSAGSVGGGTSVRTRIARLDTRLGTGEPRCVRRNNPLPGSVSRRRESGCGWQAGRRGARPLLRAPPRCARSACERRCRPRTSTSRS